jgi:hypothetical protein
MVNRSFVGIWLSESGITDAEQLEITVAPGVILVQRYKDEVLGHKSKDLSMSLNL